MKLDYSEIDYLPKLANQAGKKNKARKGNPYVQ